MCVNKTYTRYQRTVIDLLNKQLGDRPFSYEKAQNNHLKVLIDGVSRPIYTGSTPSDVKSGKNFMAEVNREIRKANEEAMASETETEIEDLPPEVTPCLHEKYAKLIRNMAKNLRQLRQGLMAKEWKLVEEAQSTDVLTAHRKSLKETSIKNALATRKSDEYVTSSEMRYIEKEINKHIEFILPNTAYYAERLSPKTPITEVTPILANLGQTPKKTKKRKTLETENDNDVATLPTSTKVVQEVAFPPLEETAVTSETANTTENRPLNDLIQQPSNARVQGFKTLSQSQMQALIDDLIAAKALKRQEDIDFILQLMQEREIDIADLQSQPLAQPHVAA